MIRWILWFHLVSLAATQLQYLALDNYNFSPSCVLSTTENTLTTSHATTEDSTSSTTSSPVGSTSTPEPTKVTTSNERSSSTTFPSSSSTTSTSSTSTASSTSSSSHVSTPSTSSPSPSTTSTPTTRTASASSKKSTGESTGTCSLSLSSSCKNPTLLDIAMKLKPPSEEYKKRTGTSHYCTDSSVGSRSRAMRMLVDPIRPTYRLLLRYKIDFILTPENYRQRFEEINHTYGTKDVIYLTYETAGGQRNIAFLEMTENSCETDPSDCPPYTFEDIKEIIVVICMKPVFTAEEWNSAFNKMLVCENDECKFRL